MIDLRLGLKRIATPFFITILLVGNVAKAQDGQALFTQNCASCHAINKTLTGPALAGVESRWTSKELLHTWIKNWNKAVATGDPYAKQMAASTTNVMNTFENLGDAEIDAILAYIAKAPAAPAPGTATAVDPSGATYDESDNSILYGVLTLILAVIALVLLQVNSNLRKLTDDKEGVPSHEPIPFYRNKSYITLLTLILFVIGGYFTVKGAIGLGRNKDYQPEQPIYYSHKVHAGTNQISCLYCHGGAVEGKHANIPSVNTCMNCHMTINEYAGEKIYREDGKEVDGTAEIQKLYEYSGWDPVKREYGNNGKPVEWIKIHNLPDHVYFNHSQHTVAGKLACQTCHGNIQEMGEVKQFAELSMGWCVNCHRESKVDFVDSSGTSGNKFYSIYERYHNEIKSKKRDSVTVSDIGGIECQKCHY
ncbi:MAG: c-type cytochrome [Chitinophagaceae bacterium]|nr:c-type cytochrome [Chitinophagaceae bacterium]